MPLLDDFDLTGALRNMYGNGGVGDPLISIGAGLLSRRGMGPALAQGFQNAAAMSQIANERQQQELRNKLLTAQAARLQRPEYATHTNPITGEASFFQKDNPAAGMSPIPGQAPANAAPTFATSPAGNEYMVGPKGQTTFAPAGPEKTADTEMAKEYAKQFFGYQTAGKNAEGTLGNLRLMKSLTENPNFYSGSGEQYLTQAKKLGVSLGLSEKDIAAPNELFTKLANRFTLDMNGGSLGTGFSNADREFLAATVPNLGNTREGNRQIVDILSSVEQRKKDIAGFARDYAKKNGGHLDIGFDDALNKWAEANPLFAGHTAAQPQPQAAPMVAPAAPSQPSANVTLAPPKAGEVRKGYTFLGGNPADPNSWKKVQ